MKAILPSFTIILTSVILLTHISACKKDGNPSVNNVGYKVKTMYDSSGVSASVTYTFGFTTYTYDANGRQIKAQYSSSNSVPNSTSAYDTLIYSLATVTDYYNCPGGCGTSTTIYTINSQGLAANDNQGDNFYYDANGYLTDANYGGRVEMYSYVNSNLITEVDTGSINDTLSYSYITKVDSRDIGLSFQGKKSMNLVSMVSGVLSSYTCHILPASINF